MPPSKSYVNTNNMNAMTNDNITIAKKNAGAGNNQALSKPTMLESMTSEERVLRAMHTLRSCPFVPKCDIDQLTVMEARKLFWASTRSHQNKFLLSKITLASDLSCQRQRIKLTLRGISLCAQCFPAVLGVGPKRWYRLRARVKEGVVSPTPQPTYVRSNTKGQRVVQWLDQYVANLGQYMPHLNQVHLPPCKWRSSGSVCYQVFQ